MQRKREGEDMQRERERESTSTRHREKVRLLQHREGKTNLQIEKARHAKKENKGRDNDM